VARPLLESEATHTSMGLVGPSSDKEREIQLETHAHQRGFPMVSGAHQWLGSGSVLGFRCEDANLSPSIS
jgi:hypothetical protein